MTSKVNLVSSKFPFSIGIELTGIPEKQSQHVYTTKPQCGVVMLSDIIELELRRSRIEYFNVNQDDHCIEVSSPRFWSYKAVENWHRRVRDIMIEWGLKSHHPDMVCGGGHIHVGGMTEKLRRYTATDILNRPYLPWVFSECDEQGACDNVYKSSRVDYYSNNKLPTWNKDYSCRMSGFKTVEFRFFESPNDWDEQWDQLEFTLRYAIYLRDKFLIEKKIPELKLYSLRGLQKITPVQATYQFRKLVRDIGLDSSRYSKYIIRNLLPRWEDGRKRY